MQFLQNTFQLKYSTFQVSVFLALQDIFGNPSISNLCVSSKSKDWPVPILPILFACWLSGKMKQNDWVKLGGLNINPW